MDLRIARLVQIVHVIQVTTEAEERFQKSLVEWQTRTLAHFMAQTIQDDKGRSQMTDEASKLSITQDEGAAADTSSEDTRPLDEVMKYGDTQRALARNMRRTTPGIFGMS